MEPMLQISNMLKLKSPKLAKDGSIDIEQAETHKTQKNTTIAKDRVIR